MRHRYLARHVIDIDGVDRGLSVVETDSDTHAVTITPFETETASTIMVEGTIVVTSAGVFQVTPSGHRVPIPR